MKESSAKLLIATLVLSAPTLVGCVLPPGGVYAVAPSGAASTTWTAGSSSASTQSSIPDPAAGASASTALAPPLYFQQVTLPGLPGRCLDAASPTPGSPVQLAVCDGSSRQQWAFSPAGEIRTPDGRCLDAPGGSTADNTALWIWDCNGSPAQQFRLHGAALLGPANKCVAMSSASTSVWAPAILYSCAFAPPPPPPAPPPPAPPPPPINWSAVPEVVSACDLAFSSPAGEQGCLGAVGRYRYNPSDVIRACDLATSSDDHALRCVLAGARVHFDASNLVRACDLATSTDEGAVACTAISVGIDGDAPSAIRACDLATSSDGELQGCLRRAALGPER